MCFFDSCAGKFVTKYPHCTFRHGHTDGCNFNSSIGAASDAGRDFFQFDTCTFPGGLEDNDFGSFSTNYLNWPFCMPSTLFGSALPSRPFYSLDNDYGQQQLLMKKPFAQPVCSADSIQAKKLFIGGLAYDVTDDELKDYFSKWGEVVDAVVIKDPVTRKSRGFGFIVYKTVEMTEAAINSRPHRIKDKIVDSKKAIPREQMKSSGEPVRHSRAGKQRSRKSHNHQSQLSQTNGENAKASRSIARPSLKQSLSMDDFPELK